MDPGVSSWIADRLLVVAANLFNLLMVGIFLVRVKGPPGRDRALGIAVEALALPVVVALVLNGRAQRSAWMIGLPVLLVLFLALELLLDYILKLEFRTTRWLGPYLLLYYLSQMAMIGYAFLVSEPAGFVTLGTYFLSLAASGYSYSRVKHG